jgi:phosphatidylserine/phosphatidylglycerophosphate/cardiolipin synthase-like enzyme
MTAVAPCIPSSDVKAPPYPPVTIHHKFVVIDAETDSPVIYSGSVNMSGNSVFRNDENLLGITGSPRLARIYLAKFLHRTGAIAHGRTRSKTDSPARAPTPRASRSGFRSSGATPGREHSRGDRPGTVTQRQ